MEMITGKRCFIIPCKDTILKSNKQAFVYFDRNFALVAGGMSVKNRCLHFYFSEILHVGF